MRRGSQNSTPGPTDCAVRTRFSVKLVRVLEVDGLSFQDCGWTQYLSSATKSDKSIPYRLHYIPRFCNFIDTIATLTTDVLVLGPLSVRDTSLGAEVLVRTKDVFLSGFGAHRRKLYLSLCWTSGGDPSSRLVREFPVTTNMRDFATIIQKSTHRVVAKSVNCH